MDKDKTVLNDLYLWEKECICEVKNILLDKITKQFMHENYALVEHMLKIIILLDELIGANEEEEEEE